MVEQIIQAPQEEVEEAPRAAVYMAEQIIQAPQEEVEEAPRARRCANGRLSAQTMMDWFGFYTFDPTTGRVLREGSTWRCTARCWLLNVRAMRPKAYGPHARRWGDVGAPTGALEPWEPMEGYIDASIAAASRNTKQLAAPPPPHDLNEPSFGSHAAAPVPVLEVSRLVGSALALVLALLALSIAIAAAASPAWLVHVDASGARHEYGLFRACTTKLSSSASCAEEALADGWGDAPLNLARSTSGALSVIAVLSLCAAALLQGLRLALALVLYVPSLRSQCATWRRSAHGSGGLERGALGGLGLRRESLLGTLDGGGGAGAFETVGDLEDEEDDLEDEEGDEDVGNAETAEAVAEAVPAPAEERVPTPGDRALSRQLRLACALHIIGFVAVAAHLLASALLLSSWCIWEGAAQPALWAGAVVIGDGARLAWAAFALSLAATATQQL